MIFYTREGKAKRRKPESANTLIEVVFACFVALASALIFSATIPIAGKSRTKAEFLSVATSHAQKELEQIRGIGFASINASDLANGGLVQGTSLVNLQSAGLTSSAETGLEFTTVDGGQSDSVGAVLPSGRAFVEVTPLTTYTVQVEVVVFWNEEGTTQSTRIGTIIANTPGG